MRENITIDITKIKQMDCRALIRQLLGQPVRSTQSYDRYYSPFRDDGRQAGLTVYATGIKDYGGDGESWDAIGFVMEYLNLDFRAACEYLLGYTNIASLPTPQESTRRNTTAPSSAWQSATLQQISKYETILWQSPAILDYLRDERGLLDATIREYRLGYNPAWDEFRVEGQVCKVAPGIVIPWIAEDTLYAVRIRTRTGALALATQYDDSYLTNKYMSISGSRQSAGLFGADNLGTGQKIIITEGEFDAMLAAQVTGYPTVTRGSSGDHRNISETWLTKLASAQTIYGILDNDAAGQAASDALLTKLANYVPLTLPAGKDLSEYILAHKGQASTIFADIDLAKERAQERRQQLTENDDKTFIPTYNAPDIQADIAVDVDFISKASAQIPQDGVVVLASDKGTGKTSYGTKVVREYRRLYKSVMAITPFRSLTAAAGEQYELEHYNSLTWSQWLQANTLAITLKSIGNFGTMGTIPKPQLLVLDEFSKMLEQLHSNIYHKNEASRVYTVLQYMIANAEQVLIMDADIGAVEVEWLRAIRADVQVVVNQFNRQSGDLFVHDSRDALRDTFIEALANPQREARPIAFFSNTASEVQTLAAYLAEKTNYKILSIHSRNSSNKAQQDFLKNPDKHINDYDALLISPSAMTGIDIQTKVFAKFGHFVYSPQQTPSATGCAQLLERARHADITHIWIEQADGTAEENAEVIYEDYRLAALRSDAVLLGLEVDKAGKLNLSGITKAIHELQSQLIARDNASRNHLYENLLNLLSRNYNIQAINSAHSIHKDDIRAAAKARKDHWDNLVCTAEAVDDDTLDALIAAGTVTDEAYAGNARYHIEDFYNQPITEALYQFDKEGRGRYRITNYSQALLVNAKTLHELDWEESENDTPLTARQFRTMKARTINAFIKQVWGSQKQFLENPVLLMRDIAERTAQFLDNYEEDVRLYFKHRHDHSEDTWNVAKRLLRRFGLTFKQVRSRDELAAKRYQIDPKKFVQVQQLAQQHVEGVTKKRNSIVNSQRFSVAAP